MMHHQMLLDWQRQQREDDVRAREAERVAREKHAALEREWRLEDVVLATKAMKSNSFSNIAAGGIGFVGALLAAVVGAFVAQWLGLLP